MLPSGVTRLRGASSHATTQTDLQRLSIKAYSVAHEQTVRNNQFSFPGEIGTPGRERGKEGSSQGSHLLAPALKTYSSCISLSWVVDNTGSYRPAGCIDGGPHVGLFKICRRKEAGSGHRRHSIKNK